MFHPFANAMSFIPLLNDTSGNIKTKFQLKVSLKSKRILLKRLIYVGLTENQVSVLYPSLLFTIVTLTSRGGL